MPGRLIVISGPSGVGKSTVARRVRDELNAKISVSATTRPRKEGQEEDGRDYYFVSKSEFERMIADGAFLEYTEYLGNYYGTPAAPIQQAIRDGQDVILEIEVNGAKEIAKQFENAIIVCLQPPEDRTLRRRLEGRSRDGPTEIDKRMANARHELEQARQSGVYDHWVVNDDLDEAVKTIVRILKSETADARKSAHD